MSKFSKHKSAEKLGSVVVACVLLVGCGIGPYNTEVLCKKEGDKFEIQVVKYDHYSVFPHPHVGGKSQFLGVRVLNKNWFGKSTWIADRYFAGTYGSYVSEVCRRSDVEGDRVVIVPIIDLKNLLPHIVRLGDNAYWRGENELVISDSGDGRWVAVALPEIGPPFIADADGELLSSVLWYVDKAEIDVERIVVTQRNSLRQPMLDFADRFRGKFTRFDESDYDRGNPEREGCPECEPILERRMVSEDNGRSWRLGSYTVLRSLPTNSLVRGEGYHFDLNKKLVMPTDSDIRADDLGPQ